MARTFEHSVTTTLTVSEVHAAMTSRQYWDDRTADIGGPDAKLNSVTISEAEVDQRTADVALTQAIDASVLPSIVTAVRPGGLVIERTESWGPVEGATATGTFGATVDGTPASLTGRLRLEPSGTGCVMKVEGEAEVKIPLVGGKIEKAIIEQVIALIDHEFEYTATWSTRS